MAELIDVFHTNSSANIRKSFQVEHLTEKKKGSVDYIESNTAF